MSQPPRRLTFAVGTSLLTASLSLAATACDDKGPTVNPAPEKPHVNEGPEPEPKKPQPEVDETVNEGPEPEPEPDHVNEGPEPEPEPPNVNTRPDKQ